MKIISVFVLLAGLFGMLSAIYSTLNERRREMAILRAMGAGFPEVSAALGALLIATGTAMGIALMVDSFRVAFDDMLDLRLKADLV